MLTQPILTPSSQFFIQCVMGPEASKHLPGNFMRSSNDAFGNIIFNRCIMQIVSVKVNASPSKIFHVDCKYLQHYIEKQPTSCGDLSTATNQS